MSAELSMKLEREELSTLVEEKLTVVGCVLERRARVGHVGADCNADLERELEWMSRQIARCRELLELLRGSASSAKPAPLCKVCGAWEPSQQHHRTYLADHHAFVPAESEAGHG